MKPWEIFLRRRKTQFFLVPIIFRSQNIWFSRNKQKRNSFSILTIVSFLGRFTDDELREIFICSLCVGMILKIDGDSVKHFDIFDDITMPHGFSFNFWLPPGGDTVAITWTDENLSWERERFCRYGNRNSRKMRKWSWNYDAECLLVNPSSFDFI